MLIKLFNGLEYYAQKLGYWLFGSIAFDNPDATSEEVTSTEVSDDDYALPSIELDEETAETILKMADVCYGEGIGPDDTELLDTIADHYPRLREKYSYLYPAPNKANQGDG